ncbi:LOG family protein [Nocardioides sp.]|uniref:LOG family protein n=1 Tax=Nocardioides sp. TaxID=35761 RepID=UPI0039E39ABB
MESLAELDRRVECGVRSWSGWRLRALNLTERGEQLHRADVAGATFLGCRFANGDADRVEAEGALVLPTIKGVPVDVYRTTLYTPEELYDAGAPPGRCRYAASLDARAYAWSQQVGTPDDTLARALHDHAVDEALESWRQGRRIVGVMGGHALRRGSEGYAEAALLGARLGAIAGITVATGGGPGAMEAANLGGYLARQPDDTLTKALAMLAAVPSYRPSVGAWADAAFEVRATWPGEASLGIPTWHYGHEPPNVLAGAIAKLFRNSLREALLLQVCDGGIVFLPGAAGTVQEVFQDACENYYADASSVAPMVLVGRRYWTEERPVWPLLQSLAQGRAMAGHLHLVDSVDEAAAAIAARS